MAEPKQATAYVFFLALDDQAMSAFVVNPTIAAGDFQVSIDGAAFANLATLPVVTPAGSRLVQIDLSAAEMTGQFISLLGVDVAGAQWRDIFVGFDLPEAGSDDIFDALFNNAGVLNEVGGSRLITLFEDDGTTIKQQVRISADGLTRTKL